MSDDNLISLTEYICRMSEENQAFMLRIIGFRKTHFPCMMETRIWRVAKSFNENSGVISKRGVIEVLETLLKAIKECDGK